MALADDLRQRARATWAAGDWDGFSRLVAPVGALVLDRVGVEPGQALLDVGTGSGGTIAIPAAQRGARVVGLDLTPELLEHGRRRAAEAGVEVEWVEGDAQELPFEDASFDRVVSTFGAMFAQPPPLCGVESHVAEVFGAAGVTPSIERETVEFLFESVQDAVQHYADDFGPFVMARGMLEPQGRWDEFLAAFAELVTRFNAAGDDRATIRSDYFVITVER